jgi:trehalose/maltose transport system permease protein
MAAGLALLALFAYAVATDPQIQLARTPNGGSSAMAFLDRFGILLPLLALTIGVATVTVGAQVRRGQRSSIRMARDALTWAGLLLLFTGLLRVATQTPLVASPTLPWPETSLAPLLASLSAWLLRQPLAHLSSHRGLLEEPLAAREARLAWNLLLPALFILLAVAARPLEATIITSFTDKRFASDAIPNFVGLTHYRNLLGMRLDPISCRSDAAGECERGANGAIRWQTLPRELLAEGYRTAFIWNLPVVTGATEALALNARDRTWIRAIWTTLAFAAVSVTLELLLGLFIALTVHSEFRGRGAMRAVMLIPWAIPTVVSARLWELILKDTSAGLLNRVLLMAGAIDSPLAWLTTASLQLPSAILIDVWKTAPFMALLLLAGLQVIPKELYESARVDGASRIREFLAITLPLLRPAIAVALIFRTLDSLRVFDLFNILFGRSAHSISTYNYEMLINNQQAGYASAIGVLIFLLIFSIALLYVRFLGVNRT